MFSASKTSGPSGYNLTNSLRFRASASAYLSRTPASAGNRRAWTWSGWVKRGTLTSTMYLFGASSTTGDVVRFLSTGDIQFYFNNGSNGDIRTTQLFRDPSAWYHLVFVCDTANATAANRMKIYVNGSQITAFQSATYPAQNYDTTFNTAVIHNIAGFSPYFDGYMTEINFIDGQALTPSSFGSTNATTGVWQPAKYTGSYGTNGFYLPFSDIGLTSGSNAGLGKDFSGNTNYWTTNNISVTAGVTYDAMSDVPTLTSATVANYPTLNPLGGQGGTWSNGNLQYTGPTAWKNTLSTIMLPSTGKFYAEATLLGTGFANNDSYATFGVGTTLGTVPSSNNCSIGDGGDLNNFGTYTTGSGKLSTGDIVSLSIDRDANTFNYRVNNTTRFSGTIGTTAGVDLFFNYWSYSGSYGQMAVNFGQRPFAYTPPSGFVRLNTYNLPDSTIVKGNTVMDAVLWTGAGQTGAASITGLNFKPDFVWAKMRSAAISHTLYNSIVGGGANKALSSNGTDTEASFNANATYGYLSSFDSNGFSYFGGSSPAYFSSNGNTYVGWAWQAGQGSTSSNTDGSVASTVSVNATAGFSVVTYTGTGVTNATVGHGLGVAAKMVIVKNRTTNATSNNWWVIHASLTAGNNLYLNTTTGQFSVSGATTNGGLGSLTATTFTLASGASNSNNTNQSGTTYVAYCWAEIAGFSAFGSYTGNGSTDGTFVYTGFRPKFVMIKRRDTTSGWNIYDSSRNTYNVVDLRLLPNTSDAEATVTTFDFLSNGFKLRTSDADRNASGGTYIYMAFAENPFKNALAR